jgi:hypothetical protein
MWIAPEQPGNVVQTEIANLTASSIAAKLMVPSQPGLYRLTITLASNDGVPLPTWMVRQPTAYIVTVPARMGIGFQAPTQLRAVVGRTSSLSVTVTNSGSAPWTAPGADAKGLRLSAWLVPVAQAAGTHSPLQSVPIASLAPGASAKATLKLQAPTTVGDYLLILDVTKSDGTLLDPAGSSAHVIHLSVVVAPPQPTPTTRGDDPKRNSTSSDTASPRATDGAGSQ